MCVNSSKTSSHSTTHFTHMHLHSNAVCYRVLQVRCNALQCLTVCFSALQCGPQLYSHTTRHHYPTLLTSSFTPPLCVAVCCSAIQCVTVCPHTLPTHIFAMKVSQHHSNMRHDSTLPLSTHPTPCVCVYVCHNTFSCVCRNAFPCAP